MNDRHRAAGNTWNAVRGGWVNSHPRSSIFSPLHPDPSRCRENHADYGDEDPETILTRRIVPSLRSADDSILGAESDDRDDRQSRFTICMH